MRCIFPVLQHGHASTSNTSITGAGNYTVYVIDAATNCKDSVLFTVNSNTITPQNTNAGSNGIITCGANSTTLTGSSTSTNVTYSWSRPNTTSILSGSNTANPTVADAGTYTLIVIDNVSGCQATSTVSISQGTVNAAFIADTLRGYEPTTINFTNQSTGANTFDWNFGNGTTSTLLNPTNTYNTAGTYEVVLIASAGPCVDTAKVTVIIESGLTLEIPNVFTPNGDGANDLFTIKSKGVKEITLVIFNRWGNKLYEFTGTKAAWNGIADNGELVPDGTYFYLIKATGFDKKMIEKQNFLSLFR